MKSLKGLALSLAALGTVLGLFPPTPVQASHITFTFAVAGDVGSGANFYTLVDSLNSTLPALSFFLELGDLSYGANEESWCNTWLTGSGNPSGKLFKNIRVVTGNHDTYETLGGNINLYLQYCGFGGLSSFSSTDNKLTQNTRGRGCTWPDSTTQCYGKEYYFDWPVATPIARFIVATPQVSFYVPMVYHDTDNDDVWDTNEGVVQDLDHSQTYSSGDIVIRQPISFGDSLEVDSTGDNEVAITFVDSNNSKHWEVGETVIFDAGSNPNQQYDGSPDIVISGTEPLIGTSLVHDYFFESTYRWTYDNCSVTGTHCRWVQDAIDSARTAGIPWVIVAMHRNWIENTQGVGAEIGQSFLNMLVGRKVDLILQGHSHNYQRSKLLNINTNCPSITASSYDPDCVINAGNTFVKNRGSVLLIDGTGGELFTPLTSPPEPDAQYFQTLDDTTWGWSKITLDENKLTSTFVKTGGSGTLGETFAIKKMDFSWTPIVPRPGQVATFTADSGTSITYAWAWDDESPNGSGNPATHVYQFCGWYTVALTASDTTGWSENISHLLQVWKPPPCPLSPG